MRTNKQKHTEFFYKLDELKDRIEVYNELFRSNVPKFMKKKSLRVSYIYIKFLEISIWWQIEAGKNWEGSTSEVGN